MIRFHRKTTIAYSFLLVINWLVILVIGNFFIHLGLPREVLISLLLAEMLVVLLISLSAFVFVFLRRMPLELALVPLHGLLLVYVSWGYDFWAFPLGVAVLLNVVVSGWYLIPSARERSGTFY